MLFVRYCSNYVPWVKRDPALGVTSFKDKNRQSFRSANNLEGKFHFHTFHSDLEFDLTCFLVFKLRHWMFNYLFNFAFRLQVWLTITLNYWPIFFFLKLRDWKFNDLYNFVSYLQLNIGWQWLTDPFLCFEAMSLKFRLFV